MKLQYMDETLYKENWDFFYTENLYCINWWRWSSLVCFTRLAQIPLIAHHFLYPKLASTYSATAPYFHSPTSCSAHWRSIDSQFPKPSKCFVPHSLTTGHLGQLCLNVHAKPSALSTSFHCCNLVMSLPPAHGRCTALYRIATRYSHRICLCTIPRPSFYN